MQPDHQQSFVTLIAHEPSLQMPQLQGVLGGAFILVSTEKEASTAIVSKLLNLIVIDLDLNGLELIGLAKNSGCINSKTPVIVLFDSMDSGQRRQLIAAGIDDSLQKILVKDKLNELIRLWHGGDDGLVYFVQAIQGLLAKSRDNRKLAMTLYSKLFDELPQQVSDVENALNNNQYQRAFEIAHKIHGSALICCLQGIEESAKNLEICLMQKKYTLIEGYFLSLQRRVSTFITQRHPILDYLAKCYQ